MSKHYYTVQAIATEVVAPAMEFHGLPADAQDAYAVAEYIRGRLQTGAFYVRPEFRDPAGVGLTTAICQVLEIEPGML